MYKYTYIYIYTYKKTDDDTHLGAWACCLRHLTPFSQGSVTGCPLPGISTKSRAFSGGQLPL